MTEQETVQQEPVDAAKGIEQALDAQEQQAPAVPVTEVTSIAKEEQRTGQQIKTPSAEELVARAGSSLIANLTSLSNLIEAKRGGSYVISRRGMNRLLLSILDLPTDGIPVLLQSKEEKLGFGIGQRAVADRFLLTQHHINQEVQRIRDEKAKEEAAKAEAAAAPQNSSENNLTNNEADANNNINDVQPTVEEKESKNE